MENVLEKLFESVPKVRLLRLFMRNAESQFSFAEILVRSQLRSLQARKELKKLLKWGVARTKIVPLKYEIRRKSRSKKGPPKIVVKTKRTRVFYANPDFKLLPELRDLISKASVAERGKLGRRIKSLGNVKLCVTSGLFLNSNGNDNSRTDLLLVGDNIKKRKLDNFLNQVESELGKAIRYTTMETDEFKYRLDMYDRFLRDILEHPHEKLINRLRI